MNGIVLNDVGGNLFHSSKVNLIDEEQIFYSLRVI